jgi:hypothetical protein
MQRDSLASQGAEVLARGCAARQMLTSECWPATFRAGQEMVSRFADRSARDIAEDLTEEPRQDGPLA